MKEYVENMKEYEEIAPNVAKCELSLFCLLHISSKLFLLTYSSKLIVVDVAPSLYRLWDLGKFLAPPPNIEKHET